MASVDPCVICGKSWSPGHTCSPGAEARAIKRARTEAAQQSAERSYGDRLEEGFAMLSDDYGSPVLERAEEVRPQKKKVTASSVAYRLSRLQQTFMQQFPLEGRALHLHSRLLLKTVQRLQRRRLLTTNRDGLLLLTGFGREVKDVLCGR